MTVTAGLTVPHSINPIFQYIFDCLGFNPMNGNFDFLIQGINRLRMVSVTLILNGSPQKIVQRGQITTPRRPIDIRIPADYSIFENGAQKIDCYVGHLSSGPVLLKPNVVHVILFNFWKQKFVEHGTVTLAIDRNGGFLLLFEEKWPNDATVPQSAPNSHSLWVHRILNDDVWIFRASNATILLIGLIDLLPKRSKIYWKIGLIKWGTVRPAVAVIWMMLRFILKWKGSIFLIKPYFWKNIHKFFFIVDSNSKC